MPSRPVTTQEKVWNAPVKVLHLTLKAKYFNQIVRGEKCAEYRYNNPYWNKRLDGKHFDEVHFRNGYYRSAPFIRVELLSIHKATNFYSIVLGNILEVGHGPE